MNPLTYVLHVLLGSQGYLSFSSPQNYTTTRLLPTLLWHNTDGFTQKYRALSAKPLLAGWWYGAVVICLIPLATKNELNSSLTKHEPLSETIISGSHEFVGKFSIEHQ